MKKIIFGFLTILCLFGFSGFVYASSTTIHLTIQTPANIIYNQNIDVTSCNSDNAGGMRTTPYCAILQSGVASDWSWSWAPSAFLNSLNGISGFTTKDKNNNDVYHYWSWSLNGSEATTALNEYDLQANDLISLNFIDPVDDSDTLLGGGGALLTGITTEDTINSKTQTINTKTTIALPEVTTTTEKKNFDTEKAFEFLFSHQRANGDFGNDLYTDWVAMALPFSQKQDATLKLIKYFVSSKINNDLLTDYERHAMALLSLGLNPYDTNGKNYIKKITDSFDGTQFGDKNEDNDDIFALIVLKNVGYAKEDPIIFKDLDFLIKKQNNDGSWDNSVDMTGASILAISNFSEKNKVLSDGDAFLIQNSLSKARNFLKNEQQLDGGWGNVSSTAWAMEGILGLGENFTEWNVWDNDSAMLQNALDFLAKNQEMDGGMKNDNLQNKIWETAYVLSVISGKTWNETMQVFPKEKITKRNSKNTLAMQNLASVVTATPEVKNQIVENKSKKSWVSSLFNFLFGF